MIIRLRFNLLLYLTVILVVLKLAELIDWSWGWILAPLWMPLVIVLGIAVIGFFFAATLLAKLKKSFGVPAAPRQRENVVYDGDEPVIPDASNPRRIGKLYEHE